jgi:hypothetical protein
MDPSRFVFLDETGASTNMTRRYGRCAKGERLVGAVPHGHWKTTTFVAGLRQSGIIAPFVLDGPMTGDMFRAYVERVLAPSLEPGDVVVMDNLAAHKVAGIRNAIAAVGASVALPAAVLAGPKPDRAGALEAESAPAQGFGSDARRPVVYDRQAARPV